MSAIQFFEVSSISRITLRGEEPCRFVISAENESKARAIAAAYAEEHQQRPLMWTNHNMSTCRPWRECCDAFLKAAMKRILKKNELGIILIESWLKPGVTEKKYLR